MSIKPPIEIKDMTRPEWVKWFSKVMTESNLIDKILGSNTILITDNGDGTVTLSIKDGSVTLTKQANLAANSIQGNNTGAAATPKALTIAEVLALISLAATNSPTFAGLIINGNITVTGNVDGVVISALATSVSNLITDVNGFPDELKNLDTAEIQQLETIGATVLAAAEWATLAAINAAWADWTPTWTNLTVGNGYVYAKYKQYGKLVEGIVAIKFGNTTSISGSVSVSLPVARRAEVYPTEGSTIYPAMGIVRLISAGVGYGGGMNLLDTTMSIFTYNVAGTYLANATLSSSVPGTWTTNDQIVGRFSYEAA